MKIKESYVRRRSFLCGMLGGGAAALGAGAAVPVLQYVGNIHEELPDFVVLDAAEYDVPVGKAKSTRYGPLAVLIVRASEGEEGLRVFDATCTHFECNVGYQEDERRIYCACHGGYFDLDGRVLSGPPPAPLRQFEKKFQDGKLAIAIKKQNLEKAFE